MNRHVAEEAESRAVGGFAAYRIERVHAHLAAQASALLAREVGLTPRQWWIIADLYELKPRTATELAERSDVDKGLLSRNLKALAENGLIAMRTDPADQRQQILSLTEAGVAMYEQALPLMKARNQRLIDGVSPDDYETFLSVLDRIDAAALADIQRRGAPVSVAE